MDVLYVDRGKIWSVLEQEHRASVNSGYGNKHEFDE